MHCPATDINARITCRFHHKLLVNFSADHRCDVNPQVVVGLVTADVLKAIAGNEVRRQQPGGMAGLAAHLLTQRRHARICSCCQLTPHHVAMSAAVSELHRNRQRNQSDACPDTKGAEPGTCHLDLRFDRRDLKRHSLPLQLLPSVSAAAGRPA